MNSTNKNLDVLSGANDIKQELIAIRSEAIHNPSHVEAGGDYGPAFIKKLDYAIEHWDDPRARKAALNILIQNEEAYNEQVASTIDSLGMIDPENDEEDILGLDSDPYLNSLIEDIQFQGLGKVKKKTKEQKAANKAKRKVKRQHFFAKVKEDMKKAGKGFQRFNPLNISKRNGILLAMKTNMFKIASRLKWGYATTEQAKAAGLSPGKYEAAKKSIAEVEKMFAKIGGKVKNLKKAILKGKHGRLAGFNGSYDWDIDEVQDFEVLLGLGLSGLGDANFITTIINAAISLIKKIVEICKKNKSADDDSDIDADVAETGDVVEYAQQATADMSPEEAAEGLEGILRQRHFKQTKGNKKTDSQNFVDGIKSACYSIKHCQDQDE